MVSGSMNLGITVSADCSSCIGGNCVDVWTGFVGIGIDGADCVDGVGGVVGTDSVADCIDGVGGVVLRTGGDVVTDAIVEC